jgi:hypothetical protein
MTQIGDITSRDADNLIICKGEKMKITEAVDKYNAAEQELIIEAYEREGGDTEDVDLILLDRICARLGLGLDNDDLDNDDIAEEVNFDEYGSHFGDVSESEDEL